MDTKCFFVLFSSFFRLPSDLFHLFHTLARQPLCFAFISIISSLSWAVRFTKQFNMFELLVACGLGFWSRRTFVWLDLGKSVGVNFFELLECVESSSCVVYDSIKRYGLLQLLLLPDILVGPALQAHVVWIPPWSGLLSRGDTTLSHTVLNSLCCYRVAPTLSFVCHRILEQSCIWILFSRSVLFTCLLLKLTLSLALDLQGSQGFFLLYTQSLFTLVFF